MTIERRYLPAASLDIFLAAYDPIMTLLGFRRALLPLVEQARLEPHHRVLDVGCGTGTLAVLVKQRHPDVEIAGVDPDPKALARAVRKAARANVAVTFHRGFGDALAFPDAAFDRVFSSMMFHHVPKDEKPAVLSEIRRVLKPAGRLEFLDFANDAAHQRMLGRLRDAGFVDAARTGSRGTIAGAIAYYQASAPR
jgi:ubiquinone/menaquinone biosynthesis C-methylase UbiE